MSLAITPRTFGEVFATAFPLIGVAFWILIGLLDPSQRGESMLVPFALFGSIMGLVGAYMYKGESLFIQSRDTKLTPETLAVRLAESRYNLESDTAAMRTYTPPIPFWLGGRVYVQSDNSTVWVVGPAYVINRLRASQVS